MKNYQKFYVIYDKTPIDTHRHQKIYKHPVPSLTRRVKIYLRSRCHKISENKSSFYASFMTCISRLSDIFSQALEPSHNSCTQDFGNSTSPDFLSSFWIPQKRSTKNGPVKKKSPKKSLNEYYCDHLIRQVANVFYSYGCLSFKGLWSETQTRGQTRSAEHFFTAKNSADYFFRKT